MKKFYLILFLFVFLKSSVNAQRITVTVAGSASSGFSGDGSGGRFAQIAGPYDVCTDAAHNIYFTDQGNGRIRKLNAKNGIITTVAGGGTGTTDGIPATNAIITPKNICIDATGNLFVVSSSTNQVKKIDAVTGIITTVAGNGLSGFSGDGSAATSAEFRSILGIGIDPIGNIFIADSGNNRIRRIASGTGIITTFAGTGTSGFAGDGGQATAALLKGPAAIAINSAGTVYFADQCTTDKSMIRKIDPVTGIITTIAGNSSTTAPIFGVPLLSTWLATITGLCTDWTGNLFCNEISCSCRELDITTDSSYATGGNFYMEDFSDNLNSNLSYMHNPYGISADNADNLYIADRVNNRVRKLIQLTHTPSFAFGKGETLKACATTSIDTQMAITDIDSAQTETWTVISSPVHGTLSGFPATTLSRGKSGITIPSGTNYTGTAYYTGMDSFRIRVSDGSLSDTVNVYVTDLVGVNGIITGPSVVCAGSAILLTDSLMGGIWNINDSSEATISGAGIVTGISSGTVSVTYSAANACGPVTVNKIVTVNSLPAAGSVSGPGSVCVGNTVTFSNAITGGIWTTTNSNSSVSGSGLVTGISPGIDTIYYIVTNSCGTATVSKIIVVGHCGGLGITTIPANLPTIFPNPASSVLNIKCDPLQTGNLSISIYDATGKQVLTNELPLNTSATSQLNLSGIRDGLYLININTETEHSTYKFEIRN